MSTNGRPSMAKRQKEMARQEKQREKAAKRVQRAVQRLNPTPELTDEEIRLQALQGVEGADNGTPAAPVENAARPTA